MKRLAPASALLGLLLASQCYPQSGAAIPQGGAGHAGQASCVILKRMGPADQVTSHMYSFGIRGKQFQYIEGKLPEGFPFHGRLTDHDVRNLQGRGAEVIVIDAHYTSEDLKQAREDCRGETGKTPNQSDTRVAPAQPSPPTDPAPGTKSDPSGASAVESIAPTVSPDKAAQLEVSSIPAAADIELDGNFIGSTPSSFTVASGEHEIVVTKNGFAPWKRRIKISSGNIKINAELAPEAK